MKKPDKPSKILLDNNVFVAAIHNPKQETKTLQLVIEIIQNKKIRLIGNQYLLEKMSRYSEAYHSPTALLLLRALIAKMTIITVEPRYIKLCSNYMTQDSPVDIIHAATCLQTDSTLITNDKHYEQLKQEKIITIWSINEALNKLLP